jgi:hypothetical protein
MFLNALEEDARLPSHSRFSNSLQNARADEAQIQLESLYDPTWILTQNALAEVAQTPFDSFLESYSKLNPKCVGGSIQNSI